MDDNSPNVQLFHSDVYRILEQHRFNAHCVLTDPPYAMGENGFMGYEWDKRSPAMDPKFWRLLSDNILPGAIVLCFSSNLKAHKMVAAAEKTGFELLNTIVWARTTTFKMGRPHPEFPDYKTGKQAIRPGHEVILVLQKSPGHLSQTACLSQYGTGGFNQNAADILKYNVITHNKHSISQIHPFYSTESPNAVPDVIYVPKVSRRERDEGLHNLPVDNYGIYQIMRQGPKPVYRRNPHPTVKPLTLTRFLAQLIVPPPTFQSTLLVPFAGTGSEMIGGITAGFYNVYGIEIEEQYVEVARQRIEHFTGIQCKITPG
jgi:DNA modification methylase